jgi:hypothetical protein
MFPLAVEDGVLVWDLSNEQLKTETPILLGSEYTQCYWIKWRQDDTLGARMLMFDGVSTSGLSIEDMTRAIGMYASDTFVPTNTGTSLNVEHFNFICVVASGGTSSVFMSSDFVNLQNAGSFGHTASGTSINSIGRVGGGPGKLAAAMLWDKAFHQRK